MPLVDRFHEGFIAGRRLRVLSDLIAAQLPANVSVLDVGCGDGRLAEQILMRRPDVSIRGIDVLVRPNTAIPVEKFDGRTIPHPDDSFEAVIFVDVLHHSDDALLLLQEAARVASSGVVIKDHLLQGPLAKTTLRFMDEVGNRRHGVSLPFNYLTPDEWQAAFMSSALQLETWNDRLGIYPWPASQLFDRKLHFAARLSVKRSHPNDRQ